MANERLILTGFMGAGKSTVGPRVADELEVGFFDTDAWMKSRSGIDVPRLVKTDMDAFRRLEAAALEEVLEQEPGVISTGGGIVSSEVGRAALMASEVPVVWLQIGFDEAKSRVTEDTAGQERPLFNDAKSARELFEQRQGWYEETASHTVDATQPVEVVVEDIVNWISPKD